MNEGYEEVLGAIASSDPTPGGGSVAALSLAHAQSLTIMVARLTAGKEKWVDGHDSAELIISKWSPKIQYAIGLAEKDALAFDQVMSAYRLPKGDETEKKYRAESIREATIGAAKAPLETATEALDLLSDIEEFSNSCNSNALTDLASAAELSNSAIIIASMNVRINLDFVEGEDVDEISTRLDDVVRKSSSYLAKIKSKVFERLGWK
jgi:formiminotetrahydrofolate cyclodeaminase|tara:strand:+ start:126 stop:749 length:624 start_codon:yes stop_codon:yes gene_type:complete